MSVTLKNNRPLDCRVVLFDLDGTLVDSAPDLWHTMNHVIEKRGFSPLNLSQVRHLVGHGARCLLARGFWGEKAIPPENDPDFERAVVEFLDYYQEHLTDHSFPYPGVVEGLNDLIDKGFVLLVVTNKPEYLARRMLKQLHLLDFFSGVVGGDTLPQKKPAAEPILYALNALNFSVSESVMVGDSEVDLGAARSAGCPIILMSYGYNQAVSLDRLNPDRLLDTFEQLGYCLKRGP